MSGVCVVGSANLDLVANVDRLPAPGATVLATDYAEHAGGKGLNQAVAAARLGAAVAFVGSIGDDAAGAILAAVMRDEGIDVSGLRILPGVPTGRALISVDARAENSIVVVPGANARTSASVAGSLPAAGVVLAQMEVPLEAVVAAFRAARARGSTTVLNPAPARDLPDDLLALVDVIVPNEGEAAALGGADRLHALGVMAVVTTLGARGATVATRVGAVAVAPFSVSPVDTTGAGDAFIGALCAELSRGVGVADAARTAAAAGALATTRRGAVPSLPTRAEVRQLLDA
jgi:ribokinase